MIRKAKLRTTLGEEIKVHVAVGEKNMNGVLVPSGYLEVEVFCLFPSMERYNDAIADSEQVMNDAGVEGVLVEDIGVDFEDVRFVVVNWCSEQSEDSPGCFGKCFRTRGEAIAFLRDDMIRFVDEHGIDVSNVDTEYENEGEYKSTDDIPYSDDGNVWYGGVRHLWRVEKLHEAM